LKYEVPVIDFDLDVGDARLKEVFHRLNRTYYSLSAIEKLASEYSASEFMLVGRLLAGEILKEVPDTVELEDVGEENADPIIANVFSRDPGISDESWAWLTERAEGSYSTLIKGSAVFTTFEFDRKVPLMFTLNIMCTYLAGYFERNDKVRKYLDEKADIFEEKEAVISAIDKAAEHVAELGLPGNSLWWNKANFFTLICELARSPELIDNGAALNAERLQQFGQNVPADYALAAKEAVGRKPQRELRGAYVRDILSEPVQPDLLDHGGEAN
jgi:hypothetical protein